MVEASANFMRDFEQLFSPSGTEKLPKLSPTRPRVRKLSQKQREEEMKREKLSEESNKKLIDCYSHAPYKVIVMTSPISSPRNRSASPPHRAAERNTLTAPEPGSSTEVIGLPRTAPTRRSRAAREDEKTLTKSSPRIKFVKKLPSIDVPPQKELRTHFPDTPSGSESDPSEINDDFPSDNPTFESRDVVPSTALKSLHRSDSCISLKSGATSALPVNPEEVSQVRPIMRKSGHRTKMEDVLERDGWIIGRRGILEQPSELGWNPKGRTPPVQYDRLDFKELLGTDSDQVETWSASDRFTGRRYSVRKFSTQIAHVRLFFNELNHLKPPPAADSVGQLEVFRGACISNKLDAAWLVFDSVKCNIVAVKKEGRGIPSPLLSFLVREILQALLMLHSIGVSHNKIDTHSIFLDDERFRIILGNLSGCSRIFAGFERESPSTSRPPSSPVFSVSSVSSFSRHRPSISSASAAPSPRRKSNAPKPMYKNMNGGVDLNVFRKMFTQFDDLAIRPWHDIGRAIPELRDPIIHESVSDILAIAEVTKTLRKCEQHAPVDVCERDQALEDSFINEMASGNVKNALEALAHPFISSYSTLSWTTFSRWLRFDGYPAEIFARKLINTNPPPQVGQGAAGPNVFRFIGPRKGHESARIISGQFNVLSKVDKNQYAALFWSFANHETRLLDAEGLRNLLRASGENVTVDQVRQRILSKFGGKMTEDNFIEWWGKVDYFDKFSPT